MAYHLAAYTGCWFGSCFSVASVVVAFGLMMDNRWR